jgi:hypothetical protein
METGERELHLGLDSDRVLHATPDGPGADVFEECRLADARFAADHERLAAPTAHGVDEGIEDPAFVAAAD